MESIELIKKEVIKAVEENRKEEVERFIKEGVNIDFKDRFGTPLLHFAPNDGGTDVVKLLVENGVDINAYDSYGTTKLMQVCASGNVELVEYLLKHGADPTLQDEDGDYASDYASNVLYAKNLKLKEKPVVICKKLLDLLWNYSPEAKGMSISRLIKELQEVQKSQPDAVVRIPPLGLPVMFAIPEKDGVCLNARDGIKVSNMLCEYYKRAAAKQQDELDFFTEMLDMGFTVGDFYYALPEEEFQHARDFMEEHGLI